MFRLDGKDYIASFRSSFLKGIYDVHIWEEGKGVWHQAEITDKYPNLIERIKARILFHKALR